MVGDYKRLGLLFASVHGGARPAFIVVSLSNHDS
jgi:hypothetical protein